MSSFPTTSRPSESCSTDEVLFVSRPSSSPEGENQTLGGLRGVTDLRALFRKSFIALASPTDLILFNERIRSVEVFTDRGPTGSGGHPGGVPEASGTCARSL